MNNKNAIEISLNLLTCYCNYFKLICFLQRKDNTCTEKPNDDALKFFFLRDEQANTGQESTDK